DAAEYIRMLYESEINFVISTFWDAGYDAKLGDEMNGFVVESSGFSTFEEAIEWLVQEAVKHYPKSVFAKQVGKKEVL
ncbi:hypothetical protein KAX97_14795, partial [candidate division WOR-3 bacterium]|nr:hypothetical protein [candidate division WOR-3 bacterium]